MTVFEQWAKDWNIPPQAIAELHMRMIATVSVSDKKTPEAVVQQDIRLAAPGKGIHLWRNNNGACKDENGRQIRYGLANDSAKVNKHIKSSDLIGITPVLITQAMVGTTVGQFTSIEVKRARWVFKGTDREEAQLNWLKLINAAGGVGKFATSREDL